MNRIIQAIFVGALLGLSAAAGYWFYLSTAPGSPSFTVSDVAAPSVTSAAQLNAFVLLDPDGAEYPLGQWHGKPQIVNYWATWCAPCRKEIPLLVALQDEYSEEQLVVIGLSMDFPEDTAIVKQFASEQSIDYPILMASDVGHEIAAVYGTNNFVLPISIFVAADGTVGHIHAGELKRDQAEQMLQTIL